MPGRIDRNPQPRSLSQGSYFVQPRNQLRRSYRSARRSRQGQPHLLPLRHLWI